MHTFESVLAAPAREGIRFLVVGGLAVGQARYVRLTEDVDLLVQADGDNLAALLRVLAEVGSGAAAELTVDDLALEEGAATAQTAFSPPPRPARRAGAARNPRPPAAFFLILPFLK